MSIPNQLSIKLDWSELDLFGHINNVAYYKYVQASRVNLWKNIGLYQDFLATNIGPILANCNCNFFQPLFYPGQIKIEATVAFVKNSSFGFLHRIFNENGALAAEATDVMVYYNFNKKAKQEIPVWLKNELTNLLSA